MDAPITSKELAYEVWRQCGQNLSETVRTLSREHGLDVSRQTLSTWKKKYDWPGRAARAENEKQRREAAASDETLMTELLRQKERYERYFQTLPLGKVDNQATYGYNSILKTILEIREKGDTATRQEVPDGESRVIKTPGDAVVALQQAVEKKVNLLLTDPDSVNMKAVQELEKALALIDKLKAKNEERRENISGNKAETAEDRTRLVKMVDEVLGVG